MIAWRVELVRIGTVAPGILRSLAAELAPCLAREVTVAAVTIDPAPAFDPLRRQYRVDDLLLALLDPPPPAGVKRVGVTNLDIFLPVFTHVLGLAQHGGQVAVVSLHRLRPDEPDHPDPAGVLRRRLLREALHELGHTLGLVHCTVPWCAMRASRAAEEVDLKDAAFCRTCAGEVGLAADCPCAGRDTGDRELPRVEKEHEG